ncbi:MAG: hypothetical protein HYZ62_01000 [Candidatus Andersenbacteria bacterium]|nr:hypothetical protein [Candidatus Andersenbacteria bacterium]
MKSDRFLIEHMLDSARRIQEFITGMDYQKFTADEKTISAVVRELTVIGPRPSTPLIQTKHKHDSPATS